MARGDLCNLIQFVSQQCQDDKEKEAAAQTTSTFKCHENGEEVKQFYETLLNDETSSKNKNSPNPMVKQVVKQNSGQLAVFKRKKETNEFRSQRPNSNAVSQYSFLTQNKDMKLMYSAQMGRLDEVSELIKSGADINYQDFYGWTPLMAAVKEGHLKIVTHLLTHGSDHTVCSLEGQTASVLASMSGHDHIVQIISEFTTKDVTGTKTDRNSASLTKCAVENSGSKCNSTDNDTFFCQICKSEFSVSGWTSHETSTVHLFNKGCKPAAPSYLIPETNKGFQILLRTGWEVNKGLGPNGEGPKYPLKTVLKHDRKGLGSEVGLKKKAKITHFEPNDKSAVAYQNKLPERKMTARKAAKYAALAKEKRSRRLEQSLRLELSGGIAD